MMKKTKWLCVLLAFVMAFAFVGCNKTPTPETPVKPNTVDVAVTVGEVTDLPKATAEYTVADPSIVACNGQSVIGFKAGQTTVTAGDTVYNVTVTDNELGTTHVYDVRQTDVKLVENGKSDYVLVIPKDETDEMITESAPNEFNDLFKTATGLTLTVLTDDRVPENTTGKYFFIGDTRQAKAAGIVADRETYGQNGFRLVTRGQSVYGVGGGRFGTLYTVYEFMKWQFDFEQFAVDELRIDKNVTDRNLLAFNISDIPDFEWRTASYGEVRQLPLDNLYPERMRTHRTEELWFEVGSWVHNTLYYIPPAKYKADHPDWFWRDDWMQQLCLTRDVEGLSDEVVEVMKQYIETYPTLTAMSFTQMDVGPDGGTWCECDSCNKMQNEYGTDAASNIKFINVVAKKLRAWLEVTHPDRTIQLVIFAYHKSEDAPAVLNAETGKYEPIDESVILDDMVYVFYAPIFGGFYHDFEHEVNAELDVNMQKWNALTSHMYLWIYQLLCTNYLQPYDGINSIQNRYIYARQHKCEMMFDQAEHNAITDTDWLHLKSYLINRLSWDVMKNPQDIIAEFMQGYYHEAGDAMQALFESWREWLGYAYDAYGYIGLIGEDKLNARVFPKNVLETWLNYIDEAYAAIEPLKTTDPARYNTLYVRIKTESIAFNYVQLMVHKDKFSVDGYRQLYLDFKADCAQCDVLLYNEWNSLSPMLEDTLRSRYPDLHTLYPDLF